ncbi:protein FAM173B-like [Sinocyclocheilus grahami]|nr:PREDICTED: protein FAM173B-like [Sinocyclocheilus grahami]
MTVFLAPAVMGVLEEKLLKKLPEDARVIVCRFPFPHWPHSCTAGSGLNQVWAYDVHTAREPSRTSPITSLNQPTGHQ